MWSSRTFKNVKISSFLHFLFYTTIISDVTKGVRHGGKLRQNGPTGQLYGVHLPTLRKNMRIDGEFEW